MASIYTEIDDNKRDTSILIGFFVLILVLLGWFLGYVFIGEDYAFPTMFFALMFSGFSAFGSYYFSDKVVLGISGAYEAPQKDYDSLYRLVENLSIGAGLPKPRIFLINDTAMNAFATGRDPQHAVICFTTGIIERLDKLELEGVVAHELSHIGNYDIRLMSIVSVLVGSVTLIADWFTRGMFYGGRRRRSRESDEFGGILLIIGLVFVIISPIIATLIKLALSRRREFLADSTAAMLTRYPKGLAEALVKISGDTEILEAANGATAHLYICSPLMSATGFMAGLFDTHPPVKERVKRLLEM